MQTDFPDNPVRRKNYNKRLCVILSNCHGGRLKRLLNASPQFSAMYDATYLRVDHPDTSSLLQASDVMNCCELLIYQHLDRKWNELSSDNVRRSVPHHCVTICIPKLSWKPFWPFLTGDARNVPEEGFPFGRHPYGDKVVLDLMRENLATEEIIDRYLELDVPAVVDISELVRNNHEYLLNDPSDINLTETVMNKCAETMLFASPRHPTLPLMLAETNHILSTLSMPEITPDEARRAFINWEYELPIHPSIAQYFNIKYAAFDNTYRINGSEMTYTQYLRAYIRYE